VADAGLTDAVHPINTTSTSPRRQRPSAEAAQADSPGGIASIHLGVTNGNHDPFWLVLVFFCFFKENTTSATSVVLADQVQGVWLTMRSVGIVGPSRA
jgi:hypothetical protein